MRIPLLLHGNRFLVTSQYIDCECFLPGYGLCLSMVKLIYNGDSIKKGSINISGPFAEEVAPSLEYYDALELELSAHARLCFSEWYLLQKWCSLQRI